MTGHRTIPQTLAAFAIMGYALICAIFMPGTAIADGGDAMGFRTAGQAMGPYKMIGRYEAQDGTIAYCMNHDLAGPSNDTSWTSYNKGWTWKTDAYNAVAYNGYPNTTNIGGHSLTPDQARCATQIAIWMVEGTVGVDGSASGGSMAGSGERNLIVSAAAALYNGATSGALPSPPQYARCYRSIVITGLTRQNMLYVPQWREVSFSKTSANAKVTEGNDSYAYAGATYNIFRASDNLKVTTITTDEQGNAAYKLQPNTEYYAVETHAPSGFELDQEPYRFTTGSKGANVNLADVPKTFSLSVSKKDSATLGPAQPGATLEGAEFKLVSLSTPGFERTGSTDKNGVLTFKDVPLGDVQVTETEAPKGYKLDPTVHTYTVDESSLGNANHIELVPENDFRETVVAFDLQISKFLDDDSQEGSGMEVPGISIAFDIISKTTGKVVGRIETDEDGIASTEGQWFGDGERSDTVKGALPYDDAGYTVQEIAQTVPEGFARVDDWDISPEQMADGTTLHYIVDNHILTSRLQLVKIDEASGQTIPMAGFSFQIIDSSGSAVEQEAWYPIHETVDTFTTDENGSVMLPEPLKVGDYSVREIAAQPPYLLAGKDAPFKIENGGDAAPVTIVKISDTQAKGKASIEKRCSRDGKTLAGAEFDVVAQEDIVSPDGTVQAGKGETVESVTTGEDGKATTGKLPLGSGTAHYAFVETKPATGHVLDKTPIPFELSYKDPNTEVVTASTSTENAPTRIEIDKRVLGTGTALPGATFLLWNVEDELEQDEDEDVVLPELKPGKDMREVKTDADGKAIIEHLAAGTYHIVESKAPDGYVKDAEVRTFTISEAGLIDGKPSHTITIEDDYTKVEISKRDIADESEVPGAKLIIKDKEGDIVESWTSTTEPHLIERLPAGTYTLIEEMTPHAYDQTSSIEFTVKETGEIQKVALYDEPIQIEGEIDKRQEIADPTAPDTVENGDGSNRADVSISPDGSFDYTLDFRSTSSTWTDEFTVEDQLTGVKDGLALLTAITTPMAHEDFDGLMNVWYRTTTTSLTYSDESGANATLDDGHENPWLTDASNQDILGNDGRVIDFTGWKLWRAGIPTDEQTLLSVDDLELAEGETVCAVRFEYGRVEKGFTTRNTLWNRDDLKDEHDDINDAPDAYENGYAPAIMHMQVTNNYVDGATMDNEAKVDLYRNGGGKNLEDHDSDRVEQMPKSTIVPLAQTGVTSAAIGFLLTAAGLLSARHLIARKARR